MFPSTPSEVQAWIASTDPVPVVPLDDAVVEALGHDADSTYAEVYWLPVIGPTALWALRRLTRALDDAPDGFPLALGPLAGELGLGSGLAPSSPVVRCLARLVCFGLAEVRGGQLMVRRRLPPLARRHLRRLPPHLVEQHDAELECRGATATCTLTGGRTDPVGEAGPPVRRDSCARSGEETSL